MWTALIIWKILIVVHFVPRTEKVARLQICVVFIFINSSLHPSAFPSSKWFATHGQCSSRFFSFSLLPRFYLEVFPSVFFSLFWWLICYSSGGVFFFYSLSSCCSHMYSPLLFLPFWVSATFSACSPPFRRAHPLWSLSEGLRCSPIRCHRCGHCCPLGHLST